MALSSNDPAAKPAQASKADPMVKDAPKSSEARKAEQGGKDWPDPGQEGFVHPDGTKQAAVQLEDNKQASADRAEIGSYIHGAPLGTPGPDPQGETEKAMARAKPQDDAVDGKK